MAKIIYLLLIVLLLPTVIASSYSIEGNGFEWNVVKSSGVESAYNVSFVDAKDKKTEIHVLVLDGMVADTSDKVLKYSNGSSILDDKDKEIVLKWESAKCVGEDCFFISLSDANMVNVDNNIRIGDATLIASYENESRVSYSNNDLEVSVYLEKFVAGVWSPVNNLSLNDKDGKTYIGAVDEYYDNNTLYRWKYFSNTPIILKGNNYYFGKTLLDEVDTCSWQDSNCTHYNFIQNDTNVLLTTFFDDDGIFDPSFTEAISTSVVVNDRTYTYPNNKTLLEVNNSNNGFWDSLVFYESFEADTLVTGASSLGARDNSKYHISGDFYNDVRYNYTLGFGKGLEFDGVDDGIQYANRPHLTINDNITIMGWIVPDVLPVQDGIMAYSGSGASELEADNYVWSLTQKADDIEFIAEFGAGVNRVCTGTSSHLSVGTPTHVAIVRHTSNNGNLSIYVNGTLVDSCQGNFSSTGGTNAKLVISGLGGTHTENEFEGVMDELMVFSRSLSDADILNIYSDNRASLYSDGIVGLPNEKDIIPFNTVELQVNNATVYNDSSLSARLKYWNLENGYDTSDSLLTFLTPLDSQADDVVNSVNGSLIGDTHFVTEGRFNNSATFDGDDAIDYGTPTFMPSGNGSRTIMWWANVSSGTLDNTFWRYGSTNWFDAVIGQSAVHSCSDGTLVLISESGNFCGGEEIINDGQLHNMIISWNEPNLTMNVMIDGVLSESTTWDFDTTLDGQLTLGNDDSYTRGIIGSIDQFSVLNKSMNETTMRELYQKSLVHWQNSSSVPFTSNGDGTYNATVDLPVVTKNFISEVILNSNTGSFVSPVLDTESIVTSTTLDGQAGNVSFVSPTDSGTISNPYIISNTTILGFEDDIVNISYDWNGQNYSLFDSSTHLISNLNNLSSLGENTKLQVDWSKHDSPIILMDGAEINCTDNFGRGCYLDLDGSSNYAFVNGSEGDFDFEYNESFTTEAWIKRVSGRGVTSHSIIVKGDPLGATGWQLWISGTNYLTFTIRNTNTFRTEVRDENFDFTTDGGWHHVVAVYNWSQLGTNESVQLFIDGQERKGLTTIFNTFDNRTILNDRNVGIGASCNIASCTSVVRNFGGYIDEPRIYNRSLTKDEVYERYVSYLQKVSVTDYNLYVNQSLNSSDTLADGDYTIQVSAKDDNNNFNRTEQRSITIDTGGPADTCTYTSGDWVVDCSDDCVITTSVNIGGNKINITGTGTFTTDGANITNYIERYIKGLDNSNQCVVKGINGGYFQ